MGWYPIVATLGTGFIAIPMLILIMTKGLFNLHIITKVICWMAMLVGLALWGLGVYMGYQFNGGW